ncbi:unnamed protein product [Ceratitis capitata]|uniref:(Mediterranean fruit fly) hypothetical protein n=1 Tax=Ceratitis capitata TaxID=7213 RepID=A0A811UN26_CERCA|nr:unnamed protein product [Ceratitis capitata]
MTPSRKRNYTNAVATQQPQELIQSSCEEHAGGNHNSVFAPAASDAPPYIDITTHSHTLTQTLAAFTASAFSSTAKSSSTSLRSW